MSTKTSFVSQFDYFGSDLNFTINGQTNFKTTFGAILTIFVSIIFIIFAILFGSDFFYRLNLKVIYTSLNNRNYTNHKLDNKNFILPFRIQDFLNNPINIDNTMFLTITYGEFLPVNGSKVLTSVAKTRQIISNFSRCDIIAGNDTYLKQNFDLSQWLCLDYKKHNMSLGGFYDGFFELYVFLNLELSRLCYSRL